VGASAPKADSEPYWNLLKCGVRNWFLLNRLRLAIESYGIVWLQDALTYYNFVYVHLDRPPLLGS
jgi:hypothetical protein